MQTTLLPRRGGRIAFGRLMPPLGNAFAVRLPRRCGYWRLFLDPARRRPPNVISTNRTPCAARAPSPPRLEAGAVAANARNAAGPRLATIAAPTPPLLKADIGSNGPKQRLP